MSFTAQLVVAGQTFPVREFSWAIHQQTDVLGRPDARVQGGTLDLVLDAQPNELLESWARHDTKRLDGVVHVFEADRATVRDKVSFFAAHCVGLRKEFQDAHSVRGMSLHLSLSANQLQYAEMEVHNRWPGVAE